MTRTTNDIAEFAPRFPKMRSNEKAVQRRPEEKIVEMAPKERSFHNLLERAVDDKRAGHEPQVLKAMGQEREALAETPKRKLGSDDLAASLARRLTDDLRGLDLSSGQSTESRETEVRAAEVVEQATDTIVSVLQPESPILDAIQRDGDQPDDTDLVNVLAASAVETSRATDVSTSIDVRSVVASQSTASSSSFGGAFSTASNSEIEASNKLQTGDALRSIDVSRRTSAIGPYAGRATTPAEIHSDLARHRAAVDDGGIGLSERSSALRANQDRLLSERTTLDMSGPKGHLGNAPNMPEESERAIEVPRLLHSFFDRAGQVSRRELDATDVQRPSDLRGMLDATIGSAKQEVHFATASAPNTSAVGISKQIVNGLAAIAETSSTSADLKLSTGMAGTVASPTPLKILQIQLQPKELGEVVIRMAKRGDKLELRVQTARAVTADILRNDHKFLVEALQRENFDIESLTIQLVDPERIPASQSSTTAAQTRLTDGNSRQPGAQGEASQEQGGAGKESDDPRSDRGVLQRDQNAADVGRNGNDIIL